MEKIHTHCPKCNGTGRINQEFNSKLSAIKELREQGFTVRQIMEMLGIKSTSTVDYYLKRESNPPRIRPYKPN